MGFFEKLFAPDIEKLASEKKFDKIRQLMVKSKNKEVRAKAAEALIRSRDPSEIKFVIDKSKSIHLRTKAAEALIEIDPAAIASITTKSKSECIRIKAEDALVKSSDPAAIKHLVPLLRSERAEQRWKAQEALNRLNWVPADDNERCWFYIAQRNWKALEEMGTAALEPLHQTTTDFDVMIKKDAVLTLGKIRDDRSLPLIFKILSYNDRIVQAASIEALRAFGEKAISYYVKVLQIPDQYNSFVIDSALQEFFKLGINGIENIVNLLTPRHPYETQILDGLFSSRNIIAENQDTSRLVLKAVLGYLQGFGKKDPPKVAREVFSFLIMKLDTVGIESVASCLTPGYVVENEILEMLLSTRGIIKENQATSRRILETIAKYLASHQEVEPPKAALEIFEFLVHNLPQEKRQTFLFNESFSTKAISCQFLSKLVELLVSECSLEDLSKKLLDEISSKGVKITSKEVLGILVGKADITRPIELKVLLSVIYPIEDDIGIISLGSLAVDPLCKLFSSPIVDSSKILIAKYLIKIGDYRGLEYIEPNIEIFCEDSGVGRDFFNYIVSKEEIALSKAKSGRDLLKFYKRQTKLLSSFCFSYLSRNWVSCVLNQLKSEVRQLAKPYFGELVELFLYNKRVKDNTNETDILSDILLNYQTINQLTPNQISKLVNGLKSNSMVVRRRAAQMLTGSDWQKEKQKSPDIDYAYYLIAFGDYSIKGHPSPKFITIKSHNEALLGSLGIDDKFDEEIIEFLGYLKSKTFTDFLLNKFYSRKDHQIAWALRQIGDKKAAEEVAKFYLSPLMRGFRDKTKVDNLTGELDPLLGAYFEIILRINSFERYRTYQDPYPASYHISTSIAESAAKTLCIFQTAVAINLLHLITQIEDIQVMINYDCSVQEWGCVSFENVRVIARNELQRRGMPPYDPSAFLDERAY